MQSDNQIDTAIKFSNGIRPDLSFNGSGTTALLYRLTGNSCITRSPKCQRSSVQDVTVLRRNLTRPINIYNS